MFSDSFAAALTMMLASMLFWGSWTNTYRLAPRWPLPLFHTDYALGVCLAAWIAAYAGAGFDAPLFFKGLQQADAGAGSAALAAGVMLNAGNFLLMAGIARVGMTVAFPLSVGFSLVVSTALSYLIHPLGHPGLLGGGVALVFCAVLVNSLVYRTISKGPGSAGRGGLSMCIAAGVLFSICGALVAKALAPPRPVPPLAAAALYAFGSLLATLPLIMVVATRMPGGNRQLLKKYATPSGRAHTAGLAGGAIWGTGLVLNLAAGSRVGVAIAGAVGQANPLVAALWGIVVWKEFRGSSIRTRLLLALMLALYTAGLGLLGLSFPAS